MDGDPISIIGDYDITLENIRVELQDRRDVRYDPQEDGRVAGIHVSFDW